MATGIAIGAALPAQKGLRDPLGDGALADALGSAQQQRVRKPIVSQRFQRAG